MSRQFLIALCLATLLVACKPAAEATPPAAPVAPAEPAPATAPVATAAIPPVTFQCGDERITATFDNTVNTVTLSADGQSLVLPQAMSGSGARYADEKGNEFWNKGTNATLTRPGKPVAECAQTTQASPWDQAKARGAMFRGIGQEPGWSVEVGAGATPPLNATLDNGEREVQVMASQALAANAGFSGKTADGMAVELRITREACNDVMSGEAFTASTQLTVGDKTYTGCGRFLGE